MIRYDVLDMDFNGPYISIPHTNLKTHEPNSKTVH